MSERRLFDILPDGSVRPVEPATGEKLAARSGRFWLHESHPELTILTFAGLEPAPAATPESRAVFAVDLSGLTPIDVFGMISQSRLSLRVFCVRAGIERVILFKDGEVVTVASNRVEDRIGDLLVRMGLVEQVRLEAALDQAAGTGKRAGQILVESGLLSSHALWNAIQTQVLELFCDVSTWEGGHLIAYNLPEDFHFPHTPSSGTQGLLLEAVRRADEMSLIRKKLPDSSVTLEPTGRSQGVNEEEQRFLGQLQQPRSLVDLSRLLHASEFDVTRLAYSLLQSGAVRVASGASSEILRPPVAGQAGEAADVFNMAMGEIWGELVKAGVHEPFTKAINAYLTDPAGKFSQIFAGLSLSPEGSMPVDALLANTSALQADDRERQLSDALNELLFFALFQCGELLPSTVDIDLARRVRLIYSMLNDD